MQPEIHGYFSSVAKQYNLPSKTTFNTAVQSAVWEEETATWKVTTVDQKTKETRQKRCKVLVSAVGALSVPKKCEIPGVEKYKGTIFHSARWNHDFNYSDKEVVVIGTSFLSITPSSMASHPKEIPQDPIS